MIPLYGFADKDQNLYTHWFTDFDEAQREFDKDNEYVYLVCGEIPEPDDMTQCRILWHRPEKP